MIEIDRTWTKKLEHGQNFVWFTQDRLTFYSVVLPSPEKPKPGYLWTKSFTYQQPDGFEVFVRDDLPAMPLSHEQMTLARTLGWPDGENGLRKVLTVSSS